MISHMSAIYIITDRYTVYVLAWIFLVGTRLIQSLNQYLRRGTSSENTGLVAAGMDKGKGKGKKNLANFPVLQVGADPFSDGLRLPWVHVAPRDESRKNRLRSHEWLCGDCRKEDRPSWRPKGFLLQWIQIIATINNDFFLEWWFQNHCGLQTLSLLILKPSFKGKFFTNFKMFGPRTF